MERSSYDKHAMHHKWRRRSSIRTRNVPRLVPSAESDRICFRLYIIRVLTLVILLGLTTPIVAVQPSNGESQPEMAS
jgi:hypothetical protein